MYIAKKYFETRFNRVFKKDEIVPDEIAKYYLRDVELKEGELLVEDPSEVQVSKEISKEDKDIKKSKKTKKIKK